jgi:hypothetical protein
LASEKVLSGRLLGRHTGPMGVSVRSETAALAALTYDACGVSSAIIVPGIGGVYGAGFVNMRRPWLRSPLSEWGGDGGLAEEESWANDDLCCCCGWCELC